MTSRWLWAPIAGLVSIGPWLYYTLQPLTVFPHLRRELSEGCETELAWSLLDYSPHAEMGLLFHWGVALWLVVFLASSITVVIAFKVRVMTIVIAVVTAVSAAASSAALMLWQHELLMDHFSAVCGT